MLALRDDSTEEPPPIIDQPVQFRVDYESDNERLFLSVFRGEAVNVPRPMTGIVIPNFLSWLSHGNRANLAAELGVNVQQLTAPIRAAAADAMKAERARIERDRLALKKKFDLPDNFEEMWAEAKADLLIALDATCEEMALLMQVSWQMARYWARKTKWLKRWERHHPPERYEDCLPEEVAKAQSFWERRKMFLRVRDAGESYVSMGRFAGITANQARNLCKRAERDMGKPSPIERYFADSLDIKILVHA